MNQYVITIYSRMGMFKIYLPAASGEIARNTASRMYPGYIIYSVKKH